MPTGKPGKILEQLMAQLREVKTKKEAHLKAGKKLNEECDYLEEEIIKKLQGEGMTSAKGDPGRATLVNGRYPQMKDFPVFLKFVIEEGHHELLMKSVNSAGWKALLKDGQTVPGVEAFDKTRLSFTKT